MVEPIKIRGITIYDSTKAAIDLARACRNYLLKIGIPCRVISDFNNDSFILETTNESFAELANFMLKDELIEWSNNDEAKFSIMKETLEKNNFI